MGSATPKYIRPIPIPAAKSMDIQEKKEYSGWLSFLPSRTWPYLLNIKYSRKSTKIVTDQTYTQFKFTKTNALIRLRTSPVKSGSNAANSEMPIINPRLGYIIRGLKLVLNGFLSFMVWCFQAMAKGNDTLIQGSLPQGNAEGPATIRETSLTFICFSGQIYPFLRNIDIWFSNTDPATFNPSVFNQANLYVTCLHFL